MSDPARLTDQQIEEMADQGERARSRYNFGPDDIGLLQGLGRSNAALVSNLRAERATSERLREALTDLLDLAERVRGGDPNLDPEEWYVRRDFSRNALDA